MYHHRSDGQAADDCRTLLAGYQEEEGFVLHERGTAAVRVLHALHNLESSWSGEKRMGLGEVSDTAELKLALVS